MFNLPPSGDVSAAYEISSGHLYAGDVLKLRYHLVCGSRLVFRLSIDQEMPKGIGIAHFHHECYLRREKDIEFEFRLNQGGVFTIRSPSFTISDILGMRSLKGSFGESREIEVANRVDRIDVSAIRPLKYKLVSGNIVSTVRGGGYEFHSISPYAEGQDARRINWKTTARTDELWMNEFLSERSGTVVVLLDARLMLTDTGLTRAFMNRAVPAATSLVYRSLMERNAVGLIVIGDGLTSIKPGYGLRQFDRITRTLMLLKMPSASYPLLLDRAASRYVHPSAQLIVVSPLLERESVESLAELAVSHRDLLLMIPMVFGRTDAETPEAIAMELLRLRQQNNALAISRFCRTVVWEYGEELGKTAFSASVFARRPRT
jgi:uncharacterized protein (DUF58 family)